MNNNRLLPVVQVPNILQVLDQIERELMGECNECGCETEILSDNYREAIERCVEVLKPVVSGISMGAAVTRGLPLEQSQDILLSALCSLITHYAKDAGFVQVMTFKQRLLQLVSDHSPVPMHTA